VFGANWCFDCHVLDLAFQRPSWRRFSRRITKSCTSISVPTNTRTLTW
jgi:hypothetical protein